MNLNDALSAIKELREKD